MCWVCLGEFSLVFLAFVGYFEYIFNIFWCFGVFREFLVVYYFIINRKNPLKTLIIMFMALRNNPERE